MSDSTPLPATPPAAPSSPGPVKSGPETPPRRGFTAYRRFWACAVLTYAADQLTKWWIVDRLPFNTYGEADGAIPVIRGFFYLAHVGNTGAAWSMFSGQSVVLATLAVATLFAIFFWRNALGLRDGLHQVAFGLLCGGIVGNLTDRVIHKHVIDFIDLHFGSYVYPTFNIADSGIFVGVILYLWLSMRTPHHPAGK